MCRMPRKGFTKEQIAFALRQAESGTPVGEVCRKLGVSEQSFYRWKKQFAGMGISEIRRLKQLEDENTKLKRLAADLTLDKTMLQDGLLKNGKVLREAPGRRSFTGGLRCERAAGHRCVIARLPSCRSTRDCKVTH